MSLQQRAIRGEVVLINKRHLDQARDRPLAAWATRIAEDILEQAELIDAEHGGVWIETQALNAIRAKHRPGLSSEKADELATKRHEMAAMLEERPVPDDKKRELAEKLARVRELQDERRGYRLPATNEHDMLAAWRAQRPMPTDMP